MNELNELLRVISCSMTALLQHLSRTVLWISLFHKVMDWQATTSLWNFCHTHFHQYTKKSCGLPHIAQEFSHVFLQSSLRRDCTICSTITIANRSQPDPATLNIMRLVLGCCNLKVIWIWIKLIITKIIWIVQQCACGYCQTTTKFLFYLNQERFKILKLETSELSLHLAESAQKARRQIPFGFASGYLTPSFLGALSQIPFRLWGFYN